MRYLMGQTYAAVAHLAVDRHYAVAITDVLTGGMVAVQMRREFAADQAMSRPSRPRRHGQSAASCRRPMGIVVSIRPVPRREIAMQRLTISNTGHVSLETPMNFRGY